MKFTVLCVLAIYSLNSTAAFRQIWHAYKNSDTKEIRDLNSDSINEKFNFDKEFNNLSLELGASYNRDSLQRLNALSPNETIVNTYSAKLIKPTLSYGSFSIEHRHIDYDLSKWQPILRNNLDGNNQYDIRTIFGYSYDFLKDDLNVQNDLVRSDFEEKLTVAKLDQEKEYLDVFTRFIQAKLNLYQIRLSRESATKARKRMTLIKDRVQVGSSRKVDLYLAKSSYLTQTQNVETAKKDLEENMALLEFILGKKIDNSLLEFITWNKVPDVYSKEAKKNLDLILLEKRLSLSKANLEQIKNDSDISLALNLQFETNAVQNSRSGAIDQNFSGNDNKTASVVLTIPLGMDRSSALKRRYELEKKLRAKQLENKQGEVETQVKALNKQIYFAQNAFKDSRQIAISLKLAMKETNKLYARGQSNFDEVIRREENYINAKLSEKTTLANLELLIANLAFVEGNIEPFLESYRD